MWLSLVEHLVRDEGVGGSNPLIPTSTNQGFWQFRQNLFFIEFRIYHLSAALKIRCFR